MAYPAYKIADLSIKVIICTYYSMIFLFAVDFPISDDFALLDFLNKLIASDTIPEKIGLLFEQHNEHRIVTTKLIFLIYYKLFGPLNFIHLIFLGNLAIVGIYRIFIRQIPAGVDRNKLLALIIACLLFQYGSAESMLWSMASISNYFVLFFALLTLEFLKKRQNLYFIAALVSAALAVCTQGNGMIILVVGCLYLLSLKRYHQAVIWMFAAIVMVYCYFYGYQRPGHHSDPLQFYHHIGKIIVFMFAFIGSAFGVGGSHYPLLTKVSLIPTFTIGLGVCLVTLYCLYDKKHNDGNIFVWINLFVIFTSFPVALSRIDFNLSQALVSRYHINSALIVISTILLCCQKFAFQIPLKFSVHKHYLKILPIFFVLYTFVTFPMLYFFSFKIYHPIRKGNIIFPIKEKADEILKESYKNGVLRK